MKKKMAGARSQKKLLMFAASVFILVSLQIVALPSLFNGKFSSVEAATSAETKANNAASSYCNNVSPGAADVRQACLGKFKAYYLGDPPGPDCPSGNSTDNDWCAGAAKAGQSAAAKAFPDFQKLCSSFIPNAKGGSWPDFSALSGADKQKAIDQCNKGLGQGYAYSSGHYPGSASCDPGNIDKKDIMTQACYAGRSLADAHIFTPSEATAIARSGNLPKTDNSNNAAGGGGGGAGGPDSTTCESGSFSFNWALCPIFDGVQSVTSWVFDNLIKPLLMTDPICLDASGQSCDNTIYKVWSGFRIYGDIFLVIVLLVIVFGESIGGGMIDAYTAKKILPRLLAAAVLINLSIYIMAFCIDVTNIVGGGLGQILTAPLGANGYYKIQPSGIEQAEIFGGAATAGLLAGAFVLSTTGVILLILGLAITGAIAVIGVFITLIIRQAIIVALLLISPVAFALWCLPNTQQWFKRWWDTFFQMLLVYPMIIMAFAVADILGSITANNNGSGSSALNDIVAFMLLIIPLYMIPFMLRSSNRLLGAIQGAVSNVGRQINAVSGRRVLGAAGAEAGKTFNLARSGDRFRKAEQGSRKEKLNRILGGASNIDALGRTGLRPKAVKRDIAAAVQANRNTRRREEAEKSAAFQTFAGNDDMLKAAGLLYTEGEASARRHLTKSGVEGAAQETAVAQLRSAQKDLGAQNLALTAAVAKAATGTGNADGPAEGYDEIVKAAGGDMQLAGMAYADQRGGYEKARRFDALESFNSAMQHMAAINSAPAGEEREKAIAKANKEARKIARDIQGGGAVLGSRGNGVRNFVEGIQDGQQDTMKALIETRNGQSTTIQQYDPKSGTLKKVTISPAEAQRHWIQQMAADSALIDSAGGAAPEVQRLLADTVHNGPIDLTGLPENLQVILARKPDGTLSGEPKISASEAYEKLEGVEAFRQAKKVYAQRFQQDAAAAAALRNTPGAQGGGTIGPAPGPTNL